MKYIPALIARIAAVFILLPAIQIVPAYIELFLSPEAFLLKWPTVIFTIIYILVPLVIFLNPRILTGEPTEAEILDDKKINHKEMQEIGISIVGLYFFFTGITEVFYWVANYSLLTIRSFSSMTPSAIDYLSLIEPSLKLVLGLAALFGCRALSNLLNWARNAGTS